MTKDPFFFLSYFEDRRESIEHPRNVITCLPPKSGCSSWQVLMVEQLWNMKIEFLEGGVRPMSFNSIVNPQLMVNFVNNADKNKWNKFMDYLKYENNGKNDRIDTPVRFTHTRHPLARLYSAWADKFVLKNLPKNPSQKTRKEAKQKHMKIVGFVFDAHKKNILENYEDRKDELKKHPEWLVSFSGLLNYIVAGKVDMHWVPMVKQCAPCSINYDYITQLETISEDIKIISRELNLPSNTKFPEMNKKSGIAVENQEQKLAKIYVAKGISKEVLRKIHERFLLDFELFGYSFDEFMEEYDKLN